VLDVRVAQPQREVGVVGVLPLKETPGVESGSRLRLIPL
jgi:hypothetical protein